MTTTVPLQVTHSFLSPASAHRSVEQNYPIHDLEQCTLLASRCNDHYLVVAKRLRYVLRIYCRGWRTEQDVASETSMLCHLHDHGLNVCKPIRTIDGKYYFKIFAPEGPRYGVLFAYAWGEPLRCHPEREGLAYFYGHELAEIHEIGQTYKGPARSFCYEIDFLLNRPLKFLKTVLKVHPEASKQISHIAFRTLREISKILPELKYGSPFYTHCYGEAHFGNAHRQENGRLNFFDFDLSAPGWRIYDIATFLCDSIEKGYPPVIHENFLKGYQETSALHPIELQLLPHFITARWIFELGLHAENCDRWGSRFEHPERLEADLLFLQQLFTQASSKPT